MDIYLIYIIFIVLILFYILIDNRNENVKNKIRLNNLKNKIILKRNNVKNIMNQNSNNILNYCNVPVLNTEQCFKSRYYRCPNTDGSYVQCTNNYLPAPDNFNALCENRTFEMIESDKRISENCYNTIMD